MERKPMQLIVRKLMDGEEEVVTDDVSPYSEPPLWLSNEELLYWNSSKLIVRVNIVNKGEKNMGFEGFEPCAISSDGNKVIVIERRGNFETAIHVLDLEQKEMEFIKRVSHFSVQGSFIWSPDEKSLVYTRQNLTNLIPFAETGHLYWHDLETGKEIKLADKVALFGGFWLEKDPADIQK